MNKEKKKKEKNMKQVTKGEKLSEKEDDEK